MDLSHIALTIGQGKQGSTKVVDVIEFVESSWGLSTPLFPVQRVILKATYGLPLDDTKTFKVSDWRRQHFVEYTEKSYLEHLFQEGRSNIKEVVPGEERRELVLSVGRRSGKTLLAACVASYEIYKLILKGSPQKHYGLPKGDQIGIVSVATDKDQAGLLFNGVSGHVRECLAPDTRVITSEGIKPIGDLVGTYPTLLTAKGAWVKAPVRSFGKQQLYRVTLTRQGHDKVVYCSGGHRWFAVDARKPYRGRGFCEFKTTELRPGKHRLQQAFGKSYKNSVQPSPFGVAHGFTFGDGHNPKHNRHVASVRLYGEKDAHLRSFFALCPEHPRPEKESAVEFSGLPNFFKSTPPITENSSYLLGWLMGYFAADGSATSRGRVAISSVSRANLEFVRDVCAVLGIGTYSLRSETRLSNLTGKPFTMYSVALQRATLDESFFLIPAHRENFRKNGGSGVGKRHWRVKAVDETDRLEEVFCATVEGHGTFVLEDNIVTGNCGFFAPYTANNTQTYAKFQTPQDIKDSCRYSDDPKMARTTIRASFRSCVAKGLRGPGNIVIILDELAHFTDGNQQSSAKAVYDAVTPSRSAFSPKDPNDPRIPIGDVEGRIISISSPLGRQGQFYTLFQIGMKGGVASRDMLCIQAPAWEVNPTIPASEFEKHYLKDPSVFFTEYGGEFTDRTRGWIEQEDDLLVCVDVDLRPMVVAPARRPHFAGIDVGLVGDGSSIAIGHLNSDKKIILDYIDWIKAGVGPYAGVDRLEFDDVVMWIYDISRRFYLAKGIFDRWAGIPFEQALAKKGLSQLQSVFFTQNLLSDLFRNFKDMMWNKQLVLFDYPPPPEGSESEHCGYIQELLELQAEYKTKYITLVEAPNVDGKHDDRSDALVRMVWVASQHMTKPKYICGVKPTGIQGHQANRRAALKSQRLGRLRARQMGSSPDRQVSRTFPGRTRGR